MAHVLPIQSPTGPVRHSQAHLLACVHAGLGHSPKRRSIPTGLTSCYFLHYPKTSHDVRLRIGIAQLVLASVLKAMQGDLVPSLDYLTCQLGLMLDFASQYEERRFDLARRQRAEHRRGSVERRSVIEGQDGALSLHSLNSRVSTPTPRSARMPTEQSHPQGARHDSGDAVLNLCLIRRAHSNHNTSHRAHKQASNILSMMFPIRGENLSREQVSSTARLLPTLLCPGCGGHMQWRDPLYCAGCGREFETVDGVIDLVTDPSRAAERAHYDAEYARDAESPGNRRTLSSLGSIWSDPRTSALRLVWERLGTLDGKRILLLGNGSSRKELYFLTQGIELLVVSDLSSEGLRALRGSVDFDGFEDRLLFAAIDALALPFADESFDIVYAYDCVHHFPDLDRFLGEAFRVLRPGGRAIFRDDAFVPFWQFAKRTVLRPLAAVSHQRHAISPEDRRVTVEGGFRERDLERRVTRVGGMPWFVRTDLAYHLWRRGGSRFLPGRVSHWIHNPTLARHLIAFDRRLARRPRTSRNLMLLVWGFVKPATDAMRERR